MSLVHGSPRQLKLGLDFDLSLENSGVNWCKRAGKNLWNVFRSTHHVVDEIGDVKLVLKED